MRAGLEHFPTVLTGLVMSSYYAGFVLGSLMAPAVVNRVGHIRTFSAFASLASAAALCHAVFVDPISWFLLRLLTGMCFAGLCLVTESWLNEKSDNFNRGTLLSTYFVVILGATAVGQVLLNLAPVSGYDLFVLVSVVISVALVPIALTSTPMPADIEPKRMELFKLYRKSPVGVVGCLGAGLGTGAFWGLGAVYAQGVGFDTKEIASFMAFLILGGMLTQWPLGRLSDFVDRRVVIGAMTVLMAALGIVVGSGMEIPNKWLFVVGGLAGGLMLPVYGISIAHANDHMDVKDFVPASASLLLVYGSGAAAGPFVATLIMEAIGPQGLFIHAAIISAAMGLFAFYRITQRKQVSDEESVDFALVPRTTAMAFEMDPRSDEDANAVDT